MEILQNSLAFCGMLLLGCTQKRIPLLALPFLLLCVWILIAFAAAFFDALYSVKVLFLSGGFIAALTSLFFFAKKRKMLLGNTIWREHFCIILVFSALLGFYNWYYDGMFISYWDEFFHAAFVKALHYENGFWTLSSALARSEVTMTYPPMTSLLVWLFMPINSYNEAAFGIASMAFFLSIACLFYYCARQKLSCTKALLLTFIMTLFSRIIGSNATQFYLPAYTDSIQGGLFAVLLCIIMAVQKQSQSFIVLVAGLLVLSLCKGTGLVLCAYICGAIALQDLLEAQFSLKYLWHAFKKFCCLLVIPFIPYLCWTLYVNTHFADIAQTGALTNISLLFSDPLALPALEAQLESFFHRGLIVTPLAGELVYISSAFAFLLCICGLLYLAQKFCCEWPRAFTVHFIFLFIGLAGWMFLHFYAFFIYNSEDLILQANSFNRYTGVFIGAMFSTVLLLFTSYILPSKFQTSMLCVSSIFLVILTFLPLQRPAHATVPQMVMQMQNAVTFLEEHTPQGSTTFFILPKNTFQEVWALRYYLAPQRKAIYPYLHNYQAQVPRHTLQARPLPPKISFFQDLQKSQAQFLFITDEKVLKDYSAYGFCKEQKFPCLMSIDEFLRKENIY